MSKNILKKLIICSLIIISLLSIIVCPVSETNLIFADMSRKVYAEVEEKIDFSQPVQAVISEDEMLRILKRVEFMNSIENIRKEINGIDFEKIITNIELSKKAEDEINNTKNTSKDKKLVFMDDISSVEEFLAMPTENIFGDDFEKAVSFYTHILNKSDSIKLVFDTNNSKADAERMSDFMDKFNSTVLNNLFKVEGIFATGGMTYYTGNPSLIYDEILLYDDLKREILNLGINEYTEPKEAVIKINNWLCDYLSYELGTNNPYIAYTTKKANCDGYATLFDRMCQIIGVECTWESGAVKTSGTYGNHAWNKVKLDDMWYYIDVCWNDTTYNKNSYLLSLNLWYDHTREVKLNIPTWNFSSDKKVKYRDINNINILNIPTQEAFGDSYQAAMDIYNAILDNEDKVIIKLYPKEGMNSQDFYDWFEDLFIKEVLSGACELHFNTISWRSGSEGVTAEINTKKIIDKIQEFENNKHKIRAINLSLGIDETVSDLDAIAVITKYLNNQYDYTCYSEGLSRDLENKVLDSLSYAELFYNLCHDLGIDCKIIKGFKTDGQEWVSGYWNRVKIGGVWYYSDISYYKGVSYTNASSGEYFLSENLWGTHSFSMPK